MCLLTANYLTAQVWSRRYIHTPIPLPWMAFTNRLINGPCLTPQALYGIKGGLHSSLVTETGDSWYMHMCFSRHSIPGTHTLADISGCCARLAHTWYYRASETKAITIMHKYHSSLHSNTTGVCIYIDPSSTWGVYTLSQIMWSRKWPLKISDLCCK